MLSRTRVALGLTLLMSLVFAVPALAGGWAVITLDEWPADVVAGEPLTIGFTVLQHGRTPMAGLSPTITATLLKEEQFSVRARPDGEPGHYTATLTFPKEGEWGWSIQAFVDQPMPTLLVAAPSGPAASQPPGDAIPALVALRVLASAVGLAGLVLAYQRKSRLALALTLAAISLGVASFMLGAAVPQVEAQSKQSFAAAPDSSVSRVELGRKLFVAKGCITCHENNRVEGPSPYWISDYWTIDMGAPDLSNYSSAPEVLFIRLKDPAAAKSDTKMPNLGLKEAEIEALIAFINSK